MSERFDHLRVLIVGCDGLGEAAARMLTERGADVATAKSVDAGLELLRDRRFDVLLNEVSAPPKGDSRGNFIDVLRRLPPHAGGETPAIALRDSHPHSPIGGDGRYQGELTTPFDAERLTRTIRALAPASNRASADSAAADASGTAAPSSQPTSTRILQVLIVDDTRVVADVLGQIIGAIGHQPTVVHSGHQAVEAILRNGGGFDVIFSDISMPDMNGHELAERLRTLRQTGKLRAKLIVAMSGYSDPEEIKRSRESGFDRHIVKPPEFQDLEALLAEVAKM